MIHHVKIASIDDGPRKTIVIDGHESNRAITGFTLRCDSPKSVTELVVAGNVAQFDYDGVAHIRVTEETAELLTRIGWTPPPADDPIGDTTSSGPVDQRCPMCDEIVTNVRGETVDTSAGGYDAVVYVNEPCGHAHIVPAKETL